MNYTRHHYWITDNKSNIINVYNLHTPGEKTLRKRNIYEKVKEIKTNRTISMVENKIVSEMNIEDVYNVLDISDKCRLLFNEQLTIVEIDGCSSKTALEIFSLIANNEDEFVLFDIDDNAIQ